MNCNNCDRLLNYLDLLDNDKFECPSCGNIQIIIEIIED